MIVKTITAGFEFFLQRLCGLADLPTRIIRIIRIGSKHALPIQLLKFLDGCRFDGLAGRDQGKQQKSSDNDFHGNTSFSGGG
jgi:hypothetical protein